MNRRDIIKKLAFVPFIGMAIAKTSLAKSTGKTTLDSISNQIVFDNNFNDYLKSIQKVFANTFGLPVDIYFTVTHAIVYMYNGKSEQDLIIVTQYWFDKATIDERIGYTKSRLAFTLTVLKDKGAFYASINDAVAKIDLED